MYINILEALLKVVEKNLMFQPRQHTDGSYSLQLTELFETYPLLQIMLMTYTVYIVLYKIKIVTVLPWKEHDESHLIRIYIVSIPIIDFLLCFDWGFTALSIIFYLSFIKGGRNSENPQKNHLTIHKQTLTFPHVTQARLKPQRWET